MRRRGLTVLLGAVLTVLLGIQIGRTDVPFVSLSPGPTVDTLGAVDRNGEPCKNPSVPSPVPSGSPAAPEPACQLVIQITGAPTSTAKGQLRMVTVSIQPNLSLIEAIKGWWARDEAVLPRKFYYPDGVTEQQVEQQSKQEFEASQSSAETIALRKLGYPVFVTVSEVTADGASVGKLQVGDIIESVDGATVTSRQKLVELIQAKDVGTTLQIGYSRNGVKATVPITTKPGPDKKPRIGVTAQSVQHQPFQVKIRLDKIGGPSAGMMFALGIIEKMTPDDLTHGVVVAGTGEIDEEGNVGKIGGISQKLYGARAAGATVFLTPADNCEEAKRDIPEGLRLVKVSTLDDALAALNALPGGQSLPSC
jgi:PDZ domain-containing protein